LRVTKIPPQNEADSVRVRFAYFPQFATPFQGFCDKICDSGLARTIAFRLAATHAPRLLLYWVLPQKVLLGEIIVDAPAVCPGPFP
jgi:hypothetical protein